MPTRLPTFTVNMKCGNERAKCAILQSTSCDYFKSEIVTGFSTMSVYTSALPRVVMMVHIVRDQSTLQTQLARTIGLSRVYGTVCVYVDCRSLPSLLSLMHEIFYNHIHICMFLSRYTLMYNINVWHFLSNKNTFKIS